METRTNRFAEAARAAHTQATVAQVEAALAKLFFFFFFFLITGLN